MTPSIRRPATPAARPLVMIVEDDDDSRSMYALGLELSGFAVTSFPDARGAVEQAHHVCPQVIVTDLKLPGMDGLELCRKLKAAPATAQIPIIAVTGRGDERDLEVARAAGFDRILIKPCLPDELGTIIRQLLDRSHDLPPQ